MKLRLFLLLTLAALACAHAPRAEGQEPSAQPAAAWTRYTFPGEEFSAELPGVPAVFHTVRGVRGRPYGEEKVRVFSLYHEDVIYFVVSYDAPQSSESFDRFATYLNGSWGFEPAGELKSGGFEGRAYRVTGTQRGRLTYELRGEGRVFRAKRHAYLALALTEREGRPEVARFFDAFTLGGRPAGQAIPDEEPVPRFVPPQTPPSTPPWPGRGLGAREPLGDGDRKAIIVYKPEPGYTEEARKKGVSGTIILRAVLAADGRLADIEPIKWLPNGLTERAIRVARQTRFFPARKGGQTVSQRITMEFNFNVY